MKTKVANLLWKWYSCEIISQNGGKHIKVNLNVLHQGSYDVLIGMDWLEGHWSLVKCKDNTINFLTNEGVRQDIQGIKRPIKLRSITTDQLSKCIQRGCQIYVVHVGFKNSKDKIDTLENIWIIQECVDFFPGEIMGLPPKINIDLTMILIPWATPVSKSPYRMSIPKLT